MEITFLGTTSMVPTKDRNHSAILLAFKDEKILIDCGEGTQRQLRMAKIAAPRITKILITHWHGDHVLGLPGLMQTLIANDYNKDLEIYVPEGTKDNFKKMFGFFVLRGDTIRHKVIEVPEGKFFESEDFELHAFKVDHTSSSVGYVFKEKDRKRINLQYLKKFGLKQNPILKKLQQGKDIVWEGKKIKVKDATVPVKGKKISFVLDTKYFAGLVKPVKDSDILIAESTYLDDMKKVAVERKHMTAQQAGSLAKKAKVSELYLTHFSQRYQDLKLFLDEARKEFKNVKVARDFLKVRV
ncbi:ribonuclease Z [archaeon]|jgi:ribonuclease Z|nr:ribonuclease Z [archaeon]MBT4417024.1 ribonuclease Z [archaeon]